MGDYFEDGGPSSTSSNMAIFKTLHLLSVVISPGATGIAAQSQI